MHKQVEVKEQEVREFKESNSKMKEELWDSIQKWHHLEKDLESSFLKSDGSMGHVHQLRDELIELRHKNSSLEQQVKEVTLQAATTHATLQSAHASLHESQKESFHLKSLNLELVQVNKEQSFQITAHVLEMTILKREQEETQA